MDKNFTNYLRSGMPTRIQVSTEASQKPPPIIESGKKKIEYELDGFSHRDAGSRSSSRPISPSMVINHVHGKYIEAVNARKECEAELRRTRQAFETFSVRLKLLLKCSSPSYDRIAEVEELSCELAEFVMEGSMSQESIANSSREDLYHGDSDAISHGPVSRHAFLARENDSLRSQSSIFARKPQVDPTTGPPLVEDVSEEVDEEARRIRQKIDLMKQALIEKQGVIDEMRKSHAAQIRRLNTINKEEVDSLRVSLENITGTLEKWQSAFSEEIKGSPHEEDQCLTQFIREVH